MRKLKSNIDLTKVRTSLFKRREFGFISTFQGKTHKRQEEALRILTDVTSKEILYGGAAGGAKTWTGASWLVFMCLVYPDTRWFIGRDELKKIKKSTHVTLLKVAKAYGITDFKYNAQENFIKFGNGSVIEYLELKYLPRDIMFERFGSVEYTGGWIEEGGEVNFGAYDTLNTRIGRHLNKELGITAKIFVTCNPKKNWMYTEFYKPYKAGSLSEGRVFIPALVTENPFISPDYIKRLENTKDEVQRQRLSLGNWDYEDNKYSLCNYKDILSVFENDHLQSNGKNYITADIARFGSDKAVIGVWDDWDLTEIVEFDKSKTTEIQSAIEALRVRYTIPKHHCIADEDGVGGGVVDNCGILGFMNNNKPFKEVVSEGKAKVPDFKNLQTQCLYRIAEKINKHEIYISAEINHTQKEHIIQELGTIERDPKVTNKLALTTKAQIKEDIGRSPDYRDMILMRKAFDYQENKRPTLRFVR